MPTATRPSPAQTKTIDTSAAPAATAESTRVRELLKQVSAIATLPEVTAQIVRTVEDPKSTAQALHRIVSHDPALVTRILKIVNSAFYGLPGQIASIERGIVLLGLNAVKNIAVAASLGQMFRGVKLCEGYSAKDLWTHCVAVGVVARHLAKELKLPLADEAFLAGMIHDVGLLVSLQTSPEALRATCDKARAVGGDFCQIEREIMGGVDHQMLGAGLAETWKFPRSCQVVAGQHHQPHQTADANRVLLWVVFVADTLCAQGGQGFNLTAIHQKLDDAALADLKLDAALIERTRVALPELVKSASTFLG